jgi:4-amino-4-deoxy-L-arabinose transferase-like glycosyltransferase
MPRGSPRHQRSRTSLGVNTPTPAIVTQRDVQRLPRLALILFCAAYLLPGLFGRDPWKNADITAFGHMLSVARGWVDPFAPSVGGVPAVGGGLFPYWLGAAFIKLLPWLDPAFAARIPFTLMLGSVLLFTWYSAYHLARSDAAQPLPLAFGGEALPGDYARAIADGALLALIATIGLLQLGHETTPELVQLAGIGAYLYALSAAPMKTRFARATALVALPLMAGSGSPSIALLAGVSGIVLCLTSSSAGMRAFAPWVAGSALLACATAWVTQTWAWRVSAPPSPLELLRTLSWFTWPTWPMAGWTIWQWRHHIQHRHIAVPLTLGGTGVLAYFAMGGSDRALLLALPSSAVLASFALPTLKRSVSAAIDWFSVFFFTALGFAIWFIFAAMHTGVPAKTAANVFKLAAPGFKPGLSWIGVCFAVAGTLAWLALVRWRTSRNQHALWKSLVLPACGVAMCWLLLMTLWLPLLDHARSYRNLVERVARRLPSNATVATPGASVSLMTALEYFGHLQVDGITPADQSTRRYLIIALPARNTAPAIKGWQQVARERQRTINTESIVIYRRSTQPAEDKRPSQPDEDQAPPS